MGRLISTGQYSVPTISSSSNGPLHTHDDLSPARKLTLYILQVTGDVVRLRGGISLSVLNFIQFIYFNLLFFVSSLTLFGR